MFAAPGVLPNTETCKVNSQGEEVLALLLASSFLLFHMLPIKGDLSSHFFSVFVILEVNFSVKRTGEYSTCANVNQAPASLETAQRKYPQLREYDSPGLCKHTHVLRKNSSW